MSLKQAAEFRVHPFRYFSRHRAESSKVTKCIEHAPHKVKIKINNKNEIDYLLMNFSIIQILWVKFFLLNLNKQRTNMLGEK